MPDQPFFNKILVIEDVDHKYRDILGELTNFRVDEKLVYRAKTLIEAEDAVDEGGWDLVLLDISMDIAPSSAGPMRGGHANLGGMDILEKMYLTEKEYPTVIITGFDYFISSDHDSIGKGDKTIKDLEDQARKWIGDNLLACIKYGSKDWKFDLSEVIGGMNR